MGDGARQVPAGPAGRFVAPVRPHPFRLWALAGGAAVTAAFGVAAVLSFGAARTPVALPTAVVVHRGVASQSAAGTGTREHPLQIVAAPQSLVVLPTEGGGAGDPPGASATEDPNGAVPSSTSEGSTSPTATPSGRVDGSTTSTAGGGGGAGSDTSRTATSQWSSESSTPSSSSTSSSGGSELPVGTTTTSPQGDG